MDTTRSSRARFVACGVLVASSAHAHEPSDDATAAEHSEPVQILVEGQAPTSSASETTVTGAELMLRPGTRPADVVEAAPGLIAVQHSGGGKASQYFLRGFDIDHGTDLLIWVDGMPVNMPSHGHGQGYTDLHFVIPEVLSELRVHKGPYYASFGDFATAGALEMEVADRLPEGQVSVTGGQWGRLRGLAIAPLEPSESTSVMLAGEIYGQDGPFENPERLERLNLMGRATHELSHHVTARATWMSYAGSWNASGQIPLREVEAGRLDRFGAIDPTEGGSTQRHSLSLGLRGDYPDAHFDVMAYGIRYDWRLYSNFTFFLDDPVNGDQIEQTDGRDVLGTHMRGSVDHELPWVELTTTVGVQVRSDSIDNALYHDVRRERLETRVDAHVAQSSLGAYLDEQARFFPWLAVRAGIRVDRADVSVEEAAPAGSPVGTPPAGGATDALLASPKASLILSPLGWLDMFVNFGRGFHSNDARGATRSTDPADLLVAATGYEVGARTRWPEALTLTAAGYVLDLDSEQVYVGDAGTTEPTDASRRYGIETTAQLELGPYIDVDAALTLNRAVYRSNEGNAGAVALAPTRTFVGGVSARAPFGTFGSFRVRHVGERPATEDGRIQAEGWTVVGLLLGHRQGPFETRLTIENVFDTPWREVQFATESQLRGEPAPVEEIHFAPGWPFTMSVTMTYYL